VTAPELCLYFLVRRPYVGQKPRASLSLPIDPCADHVDAPCRANGQPPEAGDIRSCGNLYLIPFKVAFPGEHEATPHIGFSKGLRNFVWHGRSCRCKCASVAHTRNSVFSIYGHHPPFSRSSRPLSIPGAKMSHPRRTVIPVLRDAFFASKTRRARITEDLTIHVRCEVMAASTTRMSQRIFTSGGRAHDLGIPTPAAAGCRLPAPLRGRSYRENRRLAERRLLPSPTALGVQLWA